jgi:hypothetical protein
VAFIGKEGRWSAGGHMPGEAGSPGAANPEVCHLSPWTPLITTPEAVVGRLLGSVSPGTQVDRCGRPTPVLCDALTTLGDA